MAGNIMKKRNDSRHIYDEALSVGSLYAMWRIVRRTCKNKRELSAFELDLYSNLSKIYYELRTRTYYPGKYRTFLIFEPKPRLVMSQSVRDKLVNHFVANYYLLPYLERELIDTNVATRKHYGSSYAMKRLKGSFESILAKEAGKRIYALKVDVSKYFYSIDHEILMRKIKKKILDPDVLRLLGIIIGETNKSYINESIIRNNITYGTDIPLYGQGRGLSIGAMTSQFLAIYFLNGLDHKIKEQFHCRHYIRYMDDFLILSTDKGKLIEMMRVVSNELGNLKLNVNPKSRLYNCNDGFVFLGFRYRVVDGKLSVDCSPKTIRRIRTHLKALEHTDYEKYLLSLASYGGYLKYRNMVVGSSSSEHRVPECK